jgi:Family of unknown function (DUF6184)
VSAQRSEVRARSLRPLTLRLPLTLSLSKGALFLSLLSTCATVSTSRHVDITRQASSHTCDALARCGKIGEGKQFADLAACRTDYDAVWSKKWDRATCDKTLSQSGLDRCLSSIDATDCDSVLDFLNTALNKCAERRVCGTEE